MIETLLKLFLAVTLGGLLGYQRERIGKPAGMRTYSLVCLGAALFTILSLHGFSGEGSDPSRIASQIVIGIGFIGGGLIMRDKEHVAGLTTAAGLWATAAIGMAIGVGWITEAIVVALIVFLILVSSEKFHVKSKLPWSSP